MQLCPLIVFVKHHGCWYYMDSLQILRLQGIWTAWPRIIEFLTTKFCKRLCSVYCTWSALLCLFRLERPNTAVFQQWINLQNKIIIINHLSFKFDILRSSVFRPINHFAGSFLRCPLLQFPCLQLHQCRQAGSEHQKI